MPWFSHPAYRQARGDLVRQLKAKKYSYRHLRPIVFLCGGQRSHRRDVVAQYMRRHTDAVVFYADDVWLQLATSASHNALKMEQDLAALSDAVVVVVESPGTFAELGAFSLVGPLRQKLLPILDSAFVREQSFIRTGPVAWVDEDSAFKPCIWVDFNVIGDAAANLKERLQRIERPSRSTVDNIEIQSSSKHMLFLIADVVALFGPVTAEHVKEIIAELLDAPAPTNTEQLLSLAAAATLVARRDAKGIGHVYLSSKSVENRAVLGSGLRRAPFALSAARARIAGVLQQIAAARAVMGLFRQEENHAS